MPKTLFSLLVSYTVKIGCLGTIKTESPVLHSSADSQEIGWNFQNSVLQQKGCNTEGFFFGLGIFLFGWFFCFSRLNCTALCQDCVHSWTFYHFSAYMKWKGCTELSLQYSALFTTLEAAALQHNIANIKRHNFPSSQVSSFTVCSTTWWKKVCEPPLHIPSPTPTF